MKIERNRGFWLVYWMQKFEKNIGLQNRRFSGVLFIDLKMLQFFKVIVRIRSIFE